MIDIEPIHCAHCGPGNSMVEAYEDDHGYWKVGCGACGSHSGTLHPNHKPDARRLVIESWNRRPEEDRLRQLLSEAEKRERESRVKALEEAALRVEAKANGYQVEARDVRRSERDRRFCASVADRLCGAAADIRALKSEER